MSWFHRRSNKIGDYTVDEKIGQGGTGDVYKATHPTTGAAVAIKILSKELADEPILLKRFEQEFQTTRALQHPHIVQSLDFGVSGELPFLVMEYVEGTTLWRHIRSEGRLLMNDTVELLRPIGEALQLAHDNGLIHRDVKPDNILLDVNGRPKLTDFGLVKDLETDLNLTDSATALGTPNFMAPEQFQDSKRADHRCDIYGLAATMYMAVTGIVPFAAQGGLSILKKKMHGDLIPIRQIVPELPAAFEWNLMRAMRSRREDRPGSCREFFAGLMGESVSQESENTVERAQERRSSPRFPCNLGSHCVPIDQRVAPPWPARIVDVSTKGMALVLSRRFEPKHVLRVVLPFSEPLGHQPVYVRVCNVAPFAHGGWRIGCQFTNDLGNDDLHLLLKELPEFGVKDSEVRDLGESEKP